MQTFQDAFFPKVLYDNTDSIKLYYVFSSKVTEDDIIICM